ncbi:flavin reductase family protein, partial [Streptomyces sparsus]
MSPSGSLAATESTDAADAGGALLRAVFRQHAAGVAVITAVRPDGRPVGFTATSLTSVAASLPMVSFGVGTGSSSWPAL